MTKDQIRIKELESFNFTLLRERALSSKVTRLEEDLKLKREQLDESEREARHLRAMLNTETKAGEFARNRWEEATKQRDDYRQELMDLHDYVISGAIHDCDMGPDCPVMACLARNP